MRSIKLLAGALFACCVFLLPATPISAGEVTYTYAGLLFGYTLPPSQANQANPFGASMTGYATFDDSVVGPTYTGSIEALAFLSPGGSPLNGTFGFSNGQIVNWDLASLFAFQLIPGSSYVSAISINAGGQRYDSIGPSSIRFNNIGYARSSGPGVWNRVGNVPRTPLQTAVPKS